MSSNATAFEGIFEYNNGNEIRSGPGDVCTIPRPDTKGLAIVPHHFIPTTTESTTEEIPYGYCQCGCGQKTIVSPESDASCGYVKGVPRRFVRGHAMKYWSRVSRVEPTIEGDTAKIPIHSFNHPGLVALIDVADVERVNQLRWNPSVSKRSSTIYAQAPIYGNTKSDRKMVLLHRFILDLTPDDPDVDHIDGEGLNCRRSNLRLCTPSENARNRRKIQGKTISQFKGVSKGSRGRWFAFIKHHGKTSNLGYFDTEMEAAVAHDESARKLHGEFASLNFPTTNERSAHIEGNN